MAAGADDDRLHGGDQPALSTMVCDALGHRQWHRRDIPHAMLRVPAVPHGRRPVDRHILIGSGLASIALTLKWWAVEQQLKLPPGMLLHLAGHTEATSDPALAWSSVMTQWASCSIFLVIVAAWALGSRRAD